MDVVVCFFLLPVALMHGRVKYKYKIFINTNINVPPHINYTYSVFRVLKKMFHGVKRDSVANIVQVKSYALLFAAYVPSPFIFLLHPFTLSFMIESFYSASESI